MGRVRGFVVAAALAVALGATLAGPSGASPDAGRTTRSARGWVVTLELARVATRAGRPIRATLTLDNRTGHPVTVEGCAVDDTFAVGLANAAVPFEPVNGMVACSTTLHRGANVISERVETTYLACGGGRGTVACGPGRSMPALPAGRYHTALSWPTSRIPRPERITVTLSA